MKIIDCQQGSAMWFEARIGIVTASMADKVITPKTGKLSAQARPYAFKLLAERLLRRPTQSMDGQIWMERGKELEPAAIKQLEFEADIATKEVGFIVTDDGLVGASPDRLVIGKPIGVEAKVPAAWTHLAYLLEGHDEKYTPQVQCQCFVAELEEVIFYSWSDRMPSATIRTYRDEEYIRKLVDALDQFNDNLAELERRARGMGVFQEYPSVVDPTTAERRPGTMEELADMIEGDAGDRLAWGG